MIEEDITPRDKDGKAHGYCEWYDYKGFLIHKGCYIHGREYGYWEDYHVNGQLMEKGNYIHGERYGYHYVYYENGLLKYHHLYHMGNLLHQTSKNKLLI